VAFVGTLFLGVELGLGLAVGISLLLVIFESAYPPTAELGRLPGTNHYRNVKQYPTAERYDGLVLVRVDAPIYFANAQHCRDKVQKYYRRAEEQLQEAHAREGAPREAREVPDVKFVILEMSPVGHIDTSALHTLQELHATFRRENDAQLCLANPNPRVMQRLVRSGLADEIGRDHLFVSTNDAVHYCLDHMHSKEIMKRASEKDLQACGSDGVDEEMAAPGAAGQRQDAAPTAGVQVGLDADNL
jgi:sulfate transporter 4